MSTILHIRSSAALASSVTRRVGALAGPAGRTEPGARIVERDLVALPVPHLDPPFVEAIAARRPEDSALGLSNRLADEPARERRPGRGANVQPRHPLGPQVGSTMWPARARPFQYTSAGPVGLATGKQAVLVLGRGRAATATGLRRRSISRSLGLRMFLAFLGIADVEAIDIDGVARGAERRAQAIARAERQAGSSPGMRPPGAARRAACPHTLSQKFHEHRPDLHHPARP